MLYLKKIQIDQHTAQADFMPETSTEIGHIVVDIESEEIIDIVNVPGYESMYPGHARQRLVELAKEKTPPTECMVMWY